MPGVWIPPGEPRSRFVRVVPVCLLTVHAVLLVHAIRNNYATFDEPAHFAAGLAHWETQDYSYYSVNPPLVRMIAVLPAMAAGARAHAEPRDRAPGSRPEWPLAAEVMDRDGPRFFELLCLARLTGVLWALVGGALVYWTAERLYGPAAGCLSLLLWCFDPTVLANASLITTDVPAAVAALAATLVVRTYLIRPSARAALGAGVVIGLALTTKFSLLVLVPVWALVWTVSLPSARGQKRLVGLMQGGITLASAVFIVNAVYCFDGSFTRLSEFRFVSGLLGGPPPEGTDYFDGGKSGNRFANGRLGALPVPVPAEYLRGLDLQYRDLEHYGRGRPLYMAGQWSDKGSHWFYLYAFWIKSNCFSIGCIVLGSALLFSAASRSTCSPRDEWVLWLPAVAVLLTVSVQTGVQYFRYALPALPFLVIAAGKVAPALLRTGALARVGLVCAALGLVADTVRAAPNYLAYCNTLAGGPGRGHLHLVDGNMDWGQDLLELKRWRDEVHCAEFAGVAYFGGVDPRIEGIEYRLPPGTPVGVSLLAPTASRGVGPRPGTYAISVSFLQGIAAPAPDGTGRWRPIAPFEYSYFQRYAPVAKCGQTIFVYRVTREQANQHRRELGLPTL